MTKEHKIDLYQLASMLKTGELHGGSIRQRAQFVVALESALVEPSFTAEEMLEYGNKRVDTAFGVKLVYQSDHTEKLLAKIKSRAI